ncbi:glucuronate isomerase [Brytella acorum]|uniref:Uronate isomerase n=1 Tax=Brytella acorum TaxID=2959299 RepID=A0AA35Y1T0_9PROT|nr:glucuronate isomerase [Brytella acorum]MDF3623979.1 glucuronate isomerase [Brytella acorum]CAI9120918.1 glucuronate isomerase [Brytella acorum]
MPTLTLHPDRLFPPDEATRSIARRLHDRIASLPIISPHGHTDPAWFAGNEAFENPAELLIIPDHYVFRMLMSAGVPLESLGIPPAGGRSTADPRAVWQIFAAHYHLFRGTPSRLWLDWVFYHVFGLRSRLDAATADHYYDVIDSRLKTPEFRPRALFEQFNIEVLTTTEGPLDTLEHHASIRRSGWGGRILTAYRPDNVTNPESPGFQEAIRAFGAVTGQDVTTFAGYMRAHRARRAFFRTMGATSTDHGHPDPFTTSLPAEAVEALYRRVTTGTVTPEDARLFRGHMLTEMAGLSAEDGMVMQLHTGVFRNHNPSLFARFGADKGADIPVAVDFVHALKPLLDQWGNDPRLTLILFTLDETTFSRELAPLAGHYPALRLGPPWWFLDSPDGMSRFRAAATETAGFYNTVGFNDDTRAFLSIPARHDVARRADAAYLARLVAEHRIDEDEAEEIAHDLTYGLVKKAYQL